ncbi:hypothetical protein Lfu02_03020 [Longispora fulva]|nr:hypothetical protein Lfu02_03020 [Longispora fulva]
MRRDYQGPADLRKLQVSGQRIWSLASRFHLGELTWGFGFDLSTEACPQAPMALWESDGRVLAWGGLHRPCSLFPMVDPAARHERQHRRMGGVLERVRQGGSSWVDGQHLATACRLACTARLVGVTARARCGGSWES